MSGWALKRSATSLAVCAHLPCLLPPNHHRYPLMQRCTYMKQRRTECPLKVLQAYNGQSKTTSMITSKIVRNVRCHFLKIYFQYNVRILTSTATNLEHVLSLPGHLAHTYSIFLFNVTIWQTVTINIRGYLGSSTLAGMTSQISSHCRYA